MARSRDRSRRTTSCVPAARAGLRSQELRTYLEIFRKGGMMAPTNWYRNHRANFDEEKGSPRVDRSR